MLDVHTHILPGMDDGSRNLEQSIAMLRKEVAQGVDRVVLTPHYDAKLESPMEFARRRYAAVTLLHMAMEKEMSLPGFLTGAEVFYFDGLSRIENLEVLFIGGTNCMLVEMPFCTWNRRMMDELKMLQQIRGVKLILAHIERYRAFQRTSLFQELSENGIWLQCNTSFFLQWKTRRMAMSMFRQGLINFVASDCHGLEHRPPNLIEALEKIERKFGKDALAFLKWNEDQLLGGGA